MCIFFGSVQNRATFVHTKSILCISTRVRTSSLQSTLNIFFNSVQKRTIMLNGYNYYVHPGRVRTSFVRSSLLWTFSLFLYRGTIILNVYYVHLTFYCEHFLWLCAEQSYILNGYYIYLTWVRTSVVQFSLLWTFSLVLCRTELHTY